MLQKNILFKNFKILEKDEISIFTDYPVFKNQYRLLRQNVIYAVLKHFRKFLPEKCLIYEFGSLIKLTDRIESDVDLTICYDEKKTKITECAEELIDYTISYIFDHSIDHIHGKFQHYPIDHSYDLLTDNDNLYVLQFDKSSISYKCGPETLSENIMSIKNVRDYKSLIDGYREKYDLQCNADCLYSIYIIENTTNHDFIGDLAELEIRNNIFSSFHYIEEKCAFEETIEIAYIKKCFKNAIVSLYEMIARSRKPLKWHNRYSMTMDDVFRSHILRDFFGPLFMEKLKKAFITLLYYWDKIELFLKREGVALSTRCHLFFEKAKLNADLYEIYGRPHMLEDAESSINNLNKIISEGWNIINRRYG